MNSPGSWLKNRIKIQPLSSIININVKKIDFIPELIKFNKKTKTTLENSMKF